MNVLLKKELNKVFRDILKSVDFNKLSSFVFPSYPSDTEGYIMNCWKNGKFPEIYPTTIYQDAIYVNGVSYDGLKAIELVNSYIVDTMNNYINNANLFKIGEDKSLTKSVAMFGSDEWVNSWKNYEEGNVNDVDASKLWKTAVNVIDDIGAEVYEKISNYIDNISNIDLCSIKSLISLCKYTNYSDVLTTLEYNYPKEIEDLINLFSINKNILLNSSKVLTLDSAYSVIQAIASTDNNSIISDDPKVNDKTGKVVYTFDVGAGEVTIGNIDNNAEYIGKYYKLAEGFDTYKIKTADNSKYFKPIILDYTYIYKCDDTPFTVSASAEVRVSSAIAIYKNNYNKKPDEILAISYDTELYNWIMLPENEQLNKTEPNHNMVFHKAAGISENTPGILYPYNNDVVFIPLPPVPEDLIEYMKNRTTNPINVKRYLDGKQNTLFSPDNPNNNSIDIIAIDKYAQDDAKIKLIAANSNLYDENNKKILTYGKDDDSLEYLNAFGYTFNQLEKPENNNSVPDELSNAMVYYSFNRELNTATDESVSRHLNKDISTLVDYILLPKTITIDNAVNYSGTYDIDQSSINLNRLVWKSNSINTNIYLTSKPSYAYVKPRNTDNLSVSWLNILDETQTDNDDNETQKYNDKETKFKYNSLIYFPSLVNNNTSTMPAYQYTTETFTRSSGIGSTFWVPCTNTNNFSFQLINLSIDINIKNETNETIYNQVDIVLSYNSIGINKLTGYWKFVASMKNTKTNNTVNVSLKSNNVENADTPINHFSDNLFWDYTTLKYTGLPSDIKQMKKIFSKELIQNIKIFRDRFRFIWEVNNNNERYNNSLINIYNYNMSFDTGKYITPWSVNSTEVRVGIYLPSDNTTSHADIILKTAKNDDSQCLYYIKGDTISNSIPLVTAWSSNYYTVSRNAPTTDEYKQFIFKIFKNVITNICKLRYRQYEDDVLMQKEYKNYLESKGISNPYIYSFSSVSAEMLESDWYKNKLLGLENEMYIYKAKLDSFSTSELFSTELKYDTEEQKELFKNLKFSNKVPLNFNEQLAFEKIYFGEAKLENFTENEQIIINKEYEIRSVAQTAEYPTLSKYYKLRELKVKEYLKFLLCFIAYSTTNTKNIDKTAFGQLQLEPYLLDNNYFEIVNAISPSMYLDNGKLNEDIITAVAETLTNMCCDIADLRERLKLQTYRIYKKGTWSLIRDYIIEYIFVKLLNNIKQTFSVTNSENLEIISLLSKLLNTSFEVNLIEYEDDTEYFNIMTNDRELYRIGTNTIDLNSRYWEKSEEDNFETIDTLLDSDISAFYYTTLGLKLVDNSGKYRNTNEILKDFLSVVYSAGAVKDTIADYTNTDNQKLKTGFEKYSGVMDIGNRPYYNYKNTFHPSYQLHQYIYNFTKYVFTKYDVENLYNTANSMYVEELRDNIDTYIDTKGNVINKWINGRFDFTGYNSNYETSTNSSSKFIRNDGPFNMYALNDLLSNFDNFILSLSNSTSIYGIDIPLYYKDAELTAEEFVKLAKIIQNNKQLYFSIKDKIIYKFAIDKFNNTITLYKDKDDKNAPGILWFKPANHPISVPMFICKQNVGITEELSDDSLIKQSVGTAAVDGIQDLCIEKSAQVILKRANSYVLDSFLDFDIDEETNSFAVLFKGIDEQSLAQGLKDNGLNDDIIKNIDTNTFSVSSEIANEECWNYASGKFILFSLNKVLDLVTYTYDYFIEASHIEETSKEQNDINEDITNSSISISQCIGFTIADGVFMAAYLKDVLFKFTNFKIQPYTDISISIRTHKFDTTEYDSIDRTADISYAATQQLNTSSNITNGYVFKPFDAKFEFINNKNYITLAVIKNYSDLEQLNINIENNENITLPDLDNSINNTQLINYLGTTEYLDEIQNTKDDKTSVIANSSIETINYGELTIQNSSTDQSEATNFINILALNKMFIEFVITTTTNEVEINYFNAHTDNKFIPLYPSTDGSNYFWNIPAFNNKTSFNIQFIGRVQEQPIEIFMYEQAAKDGEYSITVKDDDSKTASRLFGYPLSAYHLTYDNINSQSQTSYEYQYFTVSVGNYYYTPIANSDAIPSLSSTILEYDKVTYVPTPISEKYTTTEVIELMNNILNATTMLSAYNNNEPINFGDITTNNLFNIELKLASTFGTTGINADNMYSKYRWLVNEQYYGSVDSASISSKTPPAAGLSVQELSAKNTDSLYNYGKFEIDEGYTITVSYRFTKQLNENEDKKTVDTTNDNDWSDATIEFTSQYCIGISELTDNIPSSGTVATFGITHIVDENGQIIYNLDELNKTTVLYLEVNKIVRKYAITLIEFNKYNNYKIKFNVTKIQ